MKLRHPLALLTSIAMLHLSVVGGDAACLTHGAPEHHAARSSGGALADGAMEMDGHVMPMAEAAEAPVVSAAGVARADVPPCEAPSQQHCCEALVGCGVAGAVAGEQQMLASGVLPATRIHEALHDAPASFAPAPEPPPPKA
jgi:hypothetical protein